VCEEHQERGVVQCCPWPGCSNGTNAESVLTNEPNGQKEHVRQVWTDEQGEHIYSWSNGSLSRWFGIMRLFNINARRKNLIPRIDDKSLPVLYHYTTPDALIKIVQTRELFLTDYSYLNDRSELTYSLGLVRDRLLAAADRFPKASSILKDWAEATKRPTSRVCVASFSEVGDNLSLWRAYGSVAVGFEANPTMFGYNNSTHLNCVIYDVERQRRLIDLFASLVASAYEADLDYVSEAGVSGATLYENCEGLIHQVSPWLKHSAFADEREVRLTHVGEDRVYERLRIPTPRRRFRTSKGVITPYLTTGDLLTVGKMPEKLPIVEVVVGPSPESELLKRGIEELLNEHGYDDVPVRSSEAPFRS
jgi:hypothetical protein